MANVRFCGHKVTDEDQRLLVHLLNDPVTVKGFVSYLTSVQRSLQHEQDKQAQTFLMNSDPTTRALALINKGKIEFLDELVTLISQVTK